MRPIAMTLLRRCAAVILALLALPVLAQSAYPTKSIRLVVPFPPGAGTDTVARFVAQKLSDRLGQQVVVDNRTGAGGAIGTAEVAKADPDGYTLLFVASPFTTVAASAKNPGYDPIAQFVPVAPIASGPLAFVVHPAVDATTMREFVELARREPGKLNYGSAGPGSVNHLALELLMARTGTNIVHVPYRGIADATKDLIAGTLQAMTASIPAALPLAADKRVRVLAVTGPKRIPQMPDVPSWQEQGVANAQVINYWGIVAPAGTPREAIARLNAETRRVLAQADVRERLEREGAELIPGDAERLGALIAADLANWKKLITEARLTFE